MLAFLKKYFHPHPEEHRAKLAYTTLVASARHPRLYTDCGLPDTLDGRYEAIVLALFKEEQRLADTPESMEYLRLLHEAFFEDMDRSLREEGVGDTGVGKRVKRMASGLYGRLQAYRDTMDNAEEFEQALLRNAYATCKTPPSKNAVLQLMHWVQTEASAQN